MHYEMFVHPSIYIFMKLKVYVEIIHVIHILLNIYKMKSGIYLICLSFINV